MAITKPCHIIFFDCCSGKLSLETINLILDELQSKGRTQSPSSSLAFYQVNASYNPKWKKKKVFITLANNKHLFGFGNKCDFQEHGPRTPIETSGSRVPAVTLTGSSTSYSGQYIDTLFFLLSQATLNGRTRKSRDALSCGALQMNGLP